jgi:hypothetical protein
MDINGRVGMKIPEWVDKWIVFALVLALGIDDLARSKGIPIGPVEYVLIPLMMAVLFMLAFLICRALCRLAARMFGVNPSSQRVRLVSNGVFFTALALIILQPIFFPGLISETVTLELPKKVNIH